MASNPPDPVQGNPPVPVGDPGRCAYCGASLTPGYYFCLACATPYKPVESVLPPQRPQMLTDGILIAKKAPHVAPLFWTYFGVVVGVAIVCHLLFEPHRPDLTVLCQVVCLLVTTCVFAAIHWPSLAVQLRRFGLASPSALVAVAALVPLLAVNYAYHGWVVNELGADRASPLDRLRESGLDEATLVAVFCLFPAVVEEIAFRGLVQHWLCVAVRPARALVLASALFAVLHFSVLSAPYIFAVGMLLGWAKWRTGSLYPSMLIHFLHNLVVVEFFPHG